MDFERELRKEKLGRTLSPEEQRDKLIQWFQTSRWFNGRQDAKILMNAHKGGWQECTPAYLRWRIDNELAELDRELESGESLDKAIDELADVGNFAMMLADRLRCGGFVRKFYTTLGNHKTECCDTERPCDHHAATEFEY